MAQERKKPSVSEVVSISTECEVPPVGSDSAGAAVRRVGCVQCF
jgi:hypothetical protein